MTRDGSDFETTTQKDTVDQKNSSWSSQPSRSWPQGVFAIPAPIKRVFDQFPLVTYQENELPARSPAHRDEHTLHIFATDGDSRLGRPSFNPGCLKWQAYLKFRGLDFRTVPSNNHASPSGALPFLLPASKTNDFTKLADPIPSKQLRKWLATRKGVEKEDEELDVRYEAYMSLLDHRIRKAWLYQLYLLESNTSSFEQLYVQPCSSNALVQKILSYQLRQAAKTELIKSSGENKIIEENVMRDAGEALEALAELLGDDEWFFAKEKPGLFDASVFAYTHLLTSDSVKWHRNPLGQVILQHANVARHAKRIENLYFAF